MKSKARISKIEDLDLEDGKYSYADYLTWEFDERVELIKGKSSDLELQPQKGFTKKYQ